jgi:hypothetical protein
MFGNKSIIAIGEIASIYPDQWVAVAVEETDSDGFALSGEVLAHDREERFVWSAVNLGEIENPIYVFHTGRKQAA